VSEIAIISGRSHHGLSKEIYNHISNIRECQFIRTELLDFSNKEIFVRYLDSVRGKDVFIIQTFNGDPNKDAMELFMMAHTAWEASAGRVTVVMPYLYGSRQDRKSSPRTPITVKLMADMLKAAKADRVITLSLHSPQSTAAFDIRCDNISTAKIFINKLFFLHKKNNYVIVSPDIGGMAKARYYANILGAEIAFGDKRRYATNKAEIMHFVGDVSERNCLVIDDMIDTGGSITEVAFELEKHGALNVDCLATHLILSGNAVEKLIDSPFRKIYGTDSIHHESLSDSFEITSINELLGDVIININEDQSVGELVEHKV
jgi:ribose-phosphate pyrophosphokinase